MEYLLKHLYLVPMFVIFIIVPTLFVLIASEKKSENKCEHSLKLNWSDGEFWVECRNCDYEKTLSQERYQEAYNFMRNKGVEWK